MEPAIPSVTKKRFPLGFFLFLFLFFSFISQLSLPSIIVKVSFLLSIGVALIVALLGSRNDLFLFMFILTSMRIIIPIAPDREFQLVLPSFFFVVSVIRFFPKFLHIRNEYLHPLLIFILLFVLLCLVGIFNGIKIPGINAPHGINSGLLNRFNLLNCLITFSASMILFDQQQLARWLKYFFTFYLVVLIISLIIIIFNLGSFPFFNSFIWSLVVENDSSKKMVIAGFSALLIFIYTLVFIRKGSIQFYFLILLSFSGLLLSGGRGPFVTGIFISFIYFVTKRKVLGKSLIIFVLSFLSSIYLLLSPLILLVPQRFQRLVIIFPPEYYTGRLSEFSESAAASSSGFRVELWTMAIEKIKEHPWFGNSFGIPEADYSFGDNFIEMFQKIPKEILYSDFLKTGSLHNTLFSITYLLGVPALLIFTYVLSRLIWNHYKKSIELPGEKRLIALFFTIYLINNAFTALVTDLLFDLSFYMLMAIAIKVLLFHYEKARVVDLRTK